MCMFRRSIAAWRIALFYLRMANGFCWLRWKMAGCYPAGWFRSMEALLAPRSGHQEAGATAPDGRRMDNGCISIPMRAARFISGVKNFLQDNLSRSLLDPQSKMVFPSIQTAALL